MTKNHHTDEEFGIVESALVYWHDAAIKLGSLLQDQPEGSEAHKLLTKIDLKGKNCPECGGSQWVAASVDYNDDGRAVGGTLKPCPICFLRENR